MPGAALTATRGADALRLSAHVWDADASLDVLLEIEPEGRRILTVKRAGTSIARIELLPSLRRELVISP